MDYFRRQDRDLTAEMGHVRDFKCASLTLLAYWLGSNGGPVAFLLTPNWHNNNNTNIIEARRTSDLCRKVGQTLN